jgi:hypothetical protein
VLGFVLSEAVVPGDGTVAFCELGRVSAAQLIKGLSE